MKTGLGDTTPSTITGNTTPWGIIIMGGLAVYGLMSENYVLTLPVAAFMGYTFILAASPGGIRF